MEGTRETTKLQKVRNLKVEHVQQGYTVVLKFDSASCSRLKACNYRLTIDSHEIGLYLAAQNYITPIKIER